MVRLFSSSIKDMVRVWKVLCYLGLKNQTKPHLTQGKQTKCGIPAFVAEGIGRRGLPQWLPRVLKMVMSSTNHTETSVFFADWMKNHQMPGRESIPEFKRPPVRDPTLSSRASEQGPLLLFSVLYTVDTLGDMAVTNVRITPATLTPPVPAVADTFSVRFVLRTLRLRGSRKQLKNRSEPGTGDLERDLLPGTAVVAPLGNRTSLLICGVTLLTLKCALWSVSFRGPLPILNRDGVNHLSHPQQGPIWIGPLLSYVENTF